MNSFEWNKIFAAVLLAALIGMLSAFIAGKLVHPERLEKTAIAIDGVDAPAETGAVAAAPAVAGDIAGLMAAADTATGQKLSRACAACHTFDKGGANRVGPNLWGIVGAKHAHAAGFAYSDVMKGMSDKPWSAEELNQFLFNPKGYAKGTKMAYAGLKNDQDRANMIAWLKTLK